MRDDEDRLLYFGLGPLAAIVLGFALIPVRELVATSTLAYLFIIVTMVAAEFGGQPAAWATALTSMLSMDFFLMKPYLRISVTEKHDMATLLGLAACGVVAAALGARRTR